MVVSTAGLNDDDCIEPTPEIVAVHGSSNTTCSRCGESKHVEPESQSHKMSPGIRKFIAPDRPFESPEHSRRHYDKAMREGKDPNVEVCFETPADYHVTREDARSCTPG